MIGRITVPHHHALRRLVKLEAERRSNQGFEKERKKKTTLATRTIKSIFITRFIVTSFFFFFSRLNRVFAMFIKSSLQAWRWLSRYLSLRSRKSLNLCTFFFYALARVLEASMRWFSSVAHCIEFIYICDRHWDEIWETWCGANSKNVGRYKVYRMSVVKALKTERTFAIFVSNPSRRKTGRRKNIYINIYKK